MSGSERVSSINPFSLTWLHPWAVIRERHLLSALFFEMTIVCLLLTRALSLTVILGALEMPLCVSRRGTVNVSL